MAFLYVSKYVRRNGQAVRENSRQTPANANINMLEGDREPIFMSVLREWLEEEMKISRAFASFKRRGLECSSYVELHTPLEVRVGFHRLSIMDPTAKGDQPFRLTFQTDRDGHPLDPRAVSADENKITARTHNVYVVCSGEIYNYKELINSNIPENYLISKSDIEVIPHLFSKFAIEGVINQIRGDFALIIVDVDMDGHTVTVHAARDPIGVKPLFWANDERCLAFCSELKGLVDVATHPIPFPPGHLMSARFMITDQTTIAEPNVNWTQFYRYDYSAVSPNELSLLPQLYARIREVLTACVSERLMSDRPLGVLLSGGLDSSLVAAIAVQELKKEVLTPNSLLHTFTIGMPGSTDEKFARIVANHISSEHHVVETNLEDFLEAIPEVVYAIESYDITTVRASTGQFLVSEYISTKTAVKVRH